MAAEADALKYTYEDYLLLPDDGKRYEIIDGEKYVSPAPTTTHQRIVVRLLSALDAAVDSAGEGEVFVAPTDVILSEQDIVQPDVMYISSGRAEIIEEHGITSAPDLIAEVLSEGSRRRDEIHKRKLYARHGVKEYWIVDPELQTVKVYRHPEGGYERVEELSLEAGDELATPMLAGFFLHLEDLFA